jgi:hypothetical protein
VRGNGDYDGNGDNDDDLSDDGGDYLCGDYRVGNADVVTIIMTIWRWWFTFLFKKLFSSHFL